MALFRNLMKFNRHQSLVRFYSVVDYSDTMPNYFKQREGLLFDLLHTHTFNDKQQQNISKFIKENQIQLEDKDLFKIDSSIKFWKNFVEEKPRLSKDNTELIDHLHVLSMVEPSLLFIDPTEMKKRVNLVQNSGFVDSKADVTKLFTNAPRALFLQEWSDVILKAYYIHNRVLDWILNKKFICLYPHPIVKYPSVMEKSYSEIKTRFLFALNSGYRSKSLYQEMNKATPYDIFRDLLVIDLDNYLQTVCKSMTGEEFVVYGEMIKLQQKEEDDLFKELSLLNNSIATQYTVVD